MAVRQDGGALWLTLDRPAALNALDGPTKQALLAALQAAAKDPGVRVVALTGAGRAFCVGQDLRELEAAYRQGRPPELAAALEAFYAPAATLLAGMAKPTVAVVNGVAAGAGASLAFACDLRLASSAATFKLAFGGIALLPDASATYHLPRLVGLARALDLALLDEGVGAEEALRIGLVTRVFPADDFPGRAAAVIARLAAGPTRALAATKRLLRANLDTELATALAREAEAQAALGRSNDHLEGVAAFLAKRPPRFSGT